MDGGDLAFLKAHLPELLQQVRKQLLDAIHAEKQRQRAI
jgi:hypothetical protein